MLEDTENQKFHLLSATAPASVRKLLMTSAPERQIFILLQTSLTTRQPLYILLMTHSVPLNLPSEMQRCVKPIPGAFERSSLGPKCFSMATHAHTRTETHNQRLLPAAESYDRSFKL